MENMDVADGGSVGPQGAQEAREINQERGGEPSEQEQGARDAAAAQRIKLALEDGEVELSLEDIKKHYNISRSSGKKFREAAELKKQTEAFFKQLNEDPASILSKFVPKEKLLPYMEEQLWQHYKYQELDPKERQRLELEEKTKQYEEKLKKYEDEKREQEMSLLVQREQEKYHKDILSAIPKSGLPQSAETIKRIASYMQQGLRKGVSLKAADVIPLVREDYYSELKSVYSGMDEESLLAALGDDIAEKIRKRDLNKVRGNFQVQTPKEQPASKERDLYPPKMSKQEWKDKMERIKRGLD